MLAKPSSFKGYKETESCYRIGRLVGRLFTTTYPKFMSRLKNAYTETNIFIGSTPPYGRKLYGNQRMLRARPRTLSTFNLRLSAKRLDSTILRIENYYLNKQTGD